MGGGPCGWLRRCAAAWSGAQGRDAARAAPLWLQFDGVQLVGERAQRGIRGLPARRPLCSRRTLALSASAWQHRRRGWRGRQAVGCTWRTLGAGATSGLAISGPGTGRGRLRGWRLWVDLHGCGPVQRLQEVETAAVALVERCGCSRPGHGSLTWLAPGRGPRGRHLDVLVHGRHQQVRRVRAGHLKRRPQAGGSNHLAFRDFCPGGGDGGAGQGSPLCGPGSLPPNPAPWPGLPGAQGVEQHWPQALAEAVGTGSMPKSEVPAGGTLQEEPRCPASRWSRWAKGLSLLWSPPSCPAV
jgi:hypothetical protein